MTVTVRRAWCLSINVPAQRVRADQRSRTAHPSGTAARYQPEIRPATASAIALSSAFVSSGASVLTALLSPPK